MSRYQPALMTEEEVEELWQRAMVEHRQLNDSFKHGCALRELTRHAVDVWRLARDYDLEIVQAPMMTGVVRIQPLDGPLVKTYLGWEPSEAETAKVQVALDEAWGRWEVRRKEPRT